MEGHGRSWTVMDGHGRSCKVMLRLEMVYVAQSWSAVVAEMTPRRRSHGATSIEMLLSASDAHSTLTASSCFGAAARRAHRCTWCNGRRRTRVGERAHTCCCAFGAEGERTGKGASCPPPARILISCAHFLEACGFSRPLCARAVLLRGVKERVTRLAHLRAGRIATKMVGELGCRHRLAQQIDRRLLGRRPTGRAWAALIEGGGRRWKVEVREGHGRRRSVEIAHLDCDEH